MSKKEIERWITVKGNHVPIYKGESEEEAIKRFDDYAKGTTKPDKETLKAKVKDISMQMQEIVDKYKEKVDKMTEQRLAPIFSKTELRVEYRDAIRHLKEAFSNLEAAFRSKDYIAPSEDVIDKITKYINQLLKQDAARYKELIKDALGDAFKNGLIDKDDEDFKDYYTYKKLPKLHAVNTGSGYIEMIDDYQEVCVALSGILEDIINKLEKHPEFNRYSYSTGDGDEGCIYID